MSRERCYPSTAGAGSPAADRFWREVFGAGSGPVYVEIGPGRGDFLLEQAGRRPGDRFFALERSGGRARRLGERIRALGLSNVRVLHADAACALACVPDEAVAGYYIHFPDPWWKRRHHRRRLIRPEVAGHLARTLVPGGALEVVTDVPAYLALTRRVLNDRPEFRLVAVDDAADLRTRYAEKAREAGAPVRRLRYRKRAAPEVLGVAAS